MHAERGAGRRARDARPRHGARGQACGNMIHTHKKENKGKKEAIVDLLAGRDLLLALLLAGAAAGGPSHPLGRPFVHAQPHPHAHEGPPAPLLFFCIGHMGMSSPNGFFCCI